MTDADVMAELKGRIAGTSPGVMDKAKVIRAIALLFAEWAALDLRDGDLRLHIVRRWMPELLTAP
jgi:hypothetical protein